MSLLETLLAASLVLLLMSVFFQVLVPSMRLAATNSVRTGMQQQANLALLRIERALRRSTDFGVSLRPSNGKDDPFVLAVHRQFDSSKPFSGAPQYEDKVAVYGWTPSLGQLSERELAPNVPVDRKHPIQRLTPSQLFTLYNTREPGPAVLARNVVLFRVVRSSLAVYTIELELTDVLPGRSAPESFALSHSLLLRNREK